MLSIEAVGEDHDIVVYSTFAATLNLVASGSDVETARSRTLPRSISMSSPPRSSTSTATPPTPTSV
ncbi:MAG: hypothetical protein MZW92_02710 [Comamonadaceae bacterium]|nr:hypothetical protein [Comamonadaceae bacterium]